MIFIRIFILYKLLCILNICRIQRKPGEIKNFILNLVSISCFLTFSKIIRSVLLYILNNNSLMNCSSLIIFTRNV